jgi:hypothetical protein
MALALFLGLALTRAAMGGQAQSAVPDRAPMPPARTVHGQPDLQGVWNFATATPMERPGALTGRDRLTDSEVAEFEIETRANADADRREAIDPAAADTAVAAAARSAAAGLSPELRFAYNNFWYDENRMKVVETKRTSLVIDPPDGRIPPLTPAARERLAARAATRGGTDGPEDRGLSERCLTGFNAGPPMTPSYYNNNIQIFQSADHVVIVNEMIHDARIVPLNRPARLPEAIRLWAGDSRGRWEGNTLVVETTNFTDETSFRGSTRHMRLVERFTPVDRDTLLYRFTVEDAATWPRPWTAEFPMRRTDDRLYEYACHEGNYGMRNLLSAARAAEGSREGRQAR